MPRPSVVLDTNVVVSAHLKSEGFERFVLDLALARKIQMYFSGEILEEYVAVLSRKKFGINPDLLANSLQLIEFSGQLVKPTKTVRAALDPDDNKFLEVALEVGAEYLVTGNKKHFPKRFGKTQVVNARELVSGLIPDLKR